ncbi:MAG: type II secretion system secretin GspD [Thiotrichaceae bacterium]
MSTNKVVFAEGAAQLNLADTDIRTLIGVVSKLTGKNFIIDPRVKGGNVSVITNRELSDEELYDTFLSVLQVHGYAVIETGNITKVVPANIAKQETHPIIENPKHEPSERLVTRLVPIKNVGSLSIVSALRPLSRNVQIQHHAESNSVVMSGRASDLERLTAIIKRMDRSNEKHITVIPLRYADAKKVVQTIQGLNKAAAGSSKLVKSGNIVSADERTNSLLVSGDDSTRQRIQDIVKKLDVPRKNEGNTKVIYLRYAKATDLVNVLQGLSKTGVVANKDGKAKTAKQSSVSTGSSNGVDIQADDASNSLIITAEPETLANLRRVISKLDVRRAQVMIETIVAEVSTNLSATLGVQFGFNGLGADNDKTGPIGVSSFAGAGGNSIGSLVASGGTSLAPGAFLGVGATIGGRQFVGLLDALSSDGATNILSTPTLVTMDNEEAEIIVGQNVPLITGSFSSSGGNGGATANNPFQTIQRQDVGLTLRVTPQINEGTSIRLAIFQEVSSLAASNASASDLITNKRSITTNVMVEDGAVLVLGGLIEDTFRDTQEKVPVLGSLPVVGRLFRHDTTSKEKQNLMVFIHPVILRDHLTSSVYTKEKYSKIQRRQKSSKILRRGTLQHRPDVFPQLKDVVTKPSTTKPSTTRKNTIIVPLSNKKASTNRKASKKLPTAKVRKAKPISKQQRNNTPTVDIPVIDDY